MKGTVRMKSNKMLAWCIIVCLVLTIGAPILSYANEGTPVISFDGNEIAPKIEPYSNELGIMVSAEDMAKLFSIEYDFNARAKYFHMTTAEHGDIYLVHNANRFISGKDEFSCAPNFYFENGMPMVEVGFFCEMFDAKYSISGSEIMISKKTDEDFSGEFRVAPEVFELTNLSASGSTTGSLATTINYPVGAPAGGLDVEIIFAYYRHYDYIGTVDAGTIRLEEGEKSVTVTLNPQEIIDEYNGYNYSIYYRIASLGLTGYVTYDGKTIEAQIPSRPFSDSARFFVYHKNKITFNLAEIDMSAYKKLSGTVSFDRNIAAPSDGLDVDLNIIPVSDERTTKYGRVYRDLGPSRKIGTVRFNGGEQSKKYTFPIASDDVSYDFPNYIVYYSTENTRNCIYKSAYLRKDGLCEIANYYYDYPSNAKLFRFASNQTANVKLVTRLSYKELQTGKAGDRISWTFDENSGILTLEGKGKMKDRLYSGEFNYIRNDVRRVVVGEGITSTGENAFSHMPNLTSVVLPSTLQEIGDGAFSHCTALPEIKIPDRVERIGSWAFSTCYNLEEITIPDSVNPNLVGVGVLYGCSVLEWIYAPNKLSKLPDWKGSMDGTVVYDCDVVYMRNGKVFASDSVEPGTVIGIPAKPSVPSGGVYYLTVNGKVHTESSITVTGNTIINQVVLSPASQVKSIVKCDTFDQTENNSSYNFSCDVESLSGASQSSSTAVVALYDSVGRMVGIKNVELSSDGKISGTVIGEDASSYKIMLIDMQSLKSSAFMCEGSLE